MAKRTTKKRKAFWLVALLWIGRLLWRLMKWIGRRSLPGLHHRLFKRTEKVQPSAQHGIHRPRRPALRGRRFASQIPQEVPSWNEPLEYCDEMATPKEWAKRQAAKEPLQDDPLPF